MGLTILGIIFIIIASVARFTTLWKVDENSKCISNDSKLVKENKINFYIILLIGIILVIAGVLYTLLCW